MKRVTLIPGDGIGPEVVNAAIRVIEASGAQIEWEVVEAGISALQKGKPVLSDEVIALIKKNGVCLKGPTETPIGSGHRSVNVTLRQELGLFANLRPVKSINGVKTRYENVDLVVIRENTEDLYVGLEQKIGNIAAISIKLITTEASTRIARFAFDFAKKEGRKKVTVVHKANIMKLSDGLFLECVRNVAKEYPEIAYEEVIVDNMCMQLVKNPERYDVILCPNLYGDIISDLCAGLVGGLGLAPSANIGDSVAVFEAVHGSAPDIAGKGIANPTAMILSAVMMLKYIGEVEKAKRIEKAVLEVLQEGKNLTPDLGGTATTEQFCENVIEKLKEF
ncbi:isocitrate dehydrogenase (NAD(+)) [Pseudothermotoga thermarum]|uniref:Isopropylmalate/isohomocitrate dehydrogenase n=1 Tax=Pseudothermotoga thermarum DSM 5069 TaxID=688269 RepID=F7YV19_9THEM|nr:isocitrate dehydrogenase (NAD(+)) [Pseudothermotoga thermarum]AEH50303.1 isopropylmalate/isohomocitrate dehydrogenase [Pseudothermotoga thermarum DSM 5069]